MYSNQVERKSLLPIKISLSTENTVICIFSERRQGQF